MAEIMKDSRQLQHCLTNKELNKLGSTNTYRVRAPLFRTKEKAKEKEKEKEEYQCIDGLFLELLKYDTNICNNPSQDTLTSMPSTNTPPIIRQSTSYDDIKYGANIEIEIESNEKKQANQNWQIIGDILASLRQSLICTNTNTNTNNKKVNINNNKRHLEIIHREYETFYFEEYAQEIFIDLRRKWLGYDSLCGETDRYVKSLFGETDVLAVDELNVNKACKYYWRRLNTNSRSGQIFFETINGEYIMKLISKSDTQFFRKSFLQKYYQYVLSEPDSLLMHVMGCYNIRYKQKKENKIKMNLGNKQDINKGVCIIIMKSILFCDMFKMHKIYDLKGSKHDRRASLYKLELDPLTLNALSVIDSSDINVTDTIKLIRDSYSTGFYQPQENENVNKFKNNKLINMANDEQCMTVYKRSKVLKDLDFVQDNQMINVGHDIKIKYLLQLRKDLNFLAAMNVMDYSLLVGMHSLNKKHWNSHISHNNIHKIGNLFTFKFGGMCAKENKNMKQNIYFTGIIDFLQRYNTKKKMESYYKRFKVAEGKDAISSVDAKTYANRLYDFIQKRIV